MSEGTPLDALETGEVKNAADTNRMQAILRDINASGADVTGPAESGGSPPMMPPMQPMPPMYPMQPAMHPMQQAQQQHYVPVDEEALQKYKPKKRNIWSSMLERARDPILVSVLMFVFMLPVLHTFMGKYASWAFAVGGQLSWIGLIALSALGGILFATYRGLADLIGL